MPRVKIIKAKSDNPIVSEVTFDTTLVGRVGITVPLGTVFDNSVAHFSIANYIYNVQFIKDSGPGHTYTQYIPRDCCEVVNDDNVII